MGQTLSEPVREKSSQSGYDERFMYAVSEMQGWRLSMEDAHTAILDLDRAGLSDDGEEASQGETSPGHSKTSFFAVYDGHGGSSVARFSGDTLHFRLRETEAYRAGNYRAALKQSFLDTDTALRNQPDFQHDPSGCTAVVALVTADNHIYVANAGDSRSVLSENGNAKALSIDHKPVNGEERDRIMKAGGFVDFGRVNGNLALSRAIGDFEFKQNKKLPPEEQIVTADPEIIEHQGSSLDEFLVIACDGIWDVLGSQDVIDWVRRAVAQRTSLQDIAEQLMDLCLAPDLDWGGVGCDNMTIMIVGLLGGRTQEQWYDEIARRVEQGVGYPTPHDLPNPFSPSKRIEVPHPQKYVISTTGLPANLVNAMVSAGIVSQEHVDREQAERELAEKKEATSLATIDDDEFGEEAGTSNHRNVDEVDEDSAPNTPTSMDAPGNAVAAAATTTI